MSMLDHALLLWFVRPPRIGYHAHIVGGSHTVTEHPNGTITVSPSIHLMYGDGRTWHGFLIRGEWTELPDTCLDKFPVTTL